ncbi:transposase, IS605 OrfB family [Ammonifex degensii KC4]|uniref:Transposase, IS605 OrfB family n=1 Tax=Ammonifex degensii (strain DSM 10501 / KC4) TaxID=429009 RepID=C9RAP9_AMMDK|nr:IS200/IS605 family accessory protein TnpB-related protein [Ammonifex degensii]ACX51326.1 transposase, IS605 OrfB family [Ammonifex degensii KC4]
MPHLHGPCKILRVRLLVGEKTSRMLQATVCLYRQVVDFCLQLFHDHQELLERGDWFRQAELLTHRTRDNPNPLYPFDAEFSNLPSGFRRAAMAEARGIALAWKSNYERWQGRRQKHEERNRKRMEQGKKRVPFTERPPVFPDEVHTWPTYYATELRRLRPERHILLKVFTGRSYGYRKVVLLDPPEIPEGYEAGSPRLVKKNHGWELHFPLFQVRSPVQDQVLKSYFFLLTDQLQSGSSFRASVLKKTTVRHLVKTDPSLRVCVVDLGLEHHAVMTVRDTEGRVLAARFLPGAEDNRLRKRYLEKVVNLQRQTRVIPEGEAFARDPWEKITNFNDYLVHRVSRQIVDFACLYGAKIIVFENLKNFRPERGTRSHYLNQKLGYWLRGRIVRYTEYKALHAGILVVRVSPTNTSRRCPLCGELSIERYTPGRENGKKLEA